jgi:hypothetical protein
VLTGELSTKITNEGSFDELLKNKGKATSFKTFQSDQADLASSRVLNTVGLGLSTADALINHLGGKLVVNCIKDKQKKPVSTETVFTMLTCAKTLCHKYSPALE